MDDSTSLAYVVTMLVAISLIGAPVTMGDWSEQADFSVERIDESQIDGETPILQYEALSTSAQNAIRRTIESPTGSYTIYGQEDWPDEFFYSDYSAPGRGLYAIVYDGQYYHLYTAAGGGIIFIYYIYELPFIAYGGALGLVARAVKEHGRSPRIALLAAIPGIAFHLLGPEFDFPLLAPMEFIGLGILTTVALVVGLVGGHVWEGYQAA